MHAGKGGGSSQGETRSTERCGVVRCRLPGARRELVRIRPTGAMKSISDEVTSSSPLLSPRLSSPLVGSQLQWFTDFSQLPRNSADVLDCRSLGPLK